MICKGAAGALEICTPRARLLRRAVVATVFCVAGIVLGLSTPLMAHLLFDGLQIYPPLAPSRLSAIAAGPPTAIVILAAGRRSYAPEFGEFGNETLDALSLERVRYGAYLARKTRLPILVSGGLLPTPLASLMAETLSSDYGIHAKWLEGRSTNTAENAIFSSEILKRVGVSHIMLVTHAWHMKRALTAFAANGMTVTPAPTAFYLTGTDGFWSAIMPSFATLHMSSYAVHEAIGGLWYKLRYGY